MYVPVKDWFVNKWATAYENQVEAERAIAKRMEEMRAEVEAEKEEEKREREAKAAAHAAAEAARKAALVPKRRDIPEATHSTIEMEQYEEVAKELGYANPALETRKFMEFLRVRGRGLYELKEVEAYLDKELGTRQDYMGHGMYHTQRLWGWRGLREGDPQNSGTQLPGPYPKPLPFHVLVLARDVAREFPEAYLYVSDEMRVDEMSRPDPFLAVRLGSGFHIIACWDEPGFDGEMK